MISEMISKRSPQDRRAVHSPHSPHSPLISASDIRAGQDMFWALAVHDRSPLTGECCFRRSEGVSDRSPFLLLRRGSATADRYTPVVVTGRRDGDQQPGNREGCGGMIKDVWVEDLRELICVLRGHLEEERMIDEGRFSVHCTRCLKGLRMVIPWDDETRERFDECRRLFADQQQRKGIEQAPVIERPVTPIARITRSLRRMGSR